MITESSKVVSDFVFDEVFKALWGDLGPNPSVLNT